MIVSARLTAHILTAAGKGGDTPDELTVILRDATDSAVLSRRIEIDRAREAGARAIWFPG